MNRLDLNRQHLAHHEDWQGDSVAFTCPRCEKVFIVSGTLHSGGRACPNCQRATGHLEDDADGGVRAWIEWE